MEQKSSFRVIFGDAPIVKVIDFFLDNREFDYSLTDVAKNADIGWSTLHLFWDDLVKLDVVTKTRRIGRAQLYRLNTHNPLVKKIIDIDAMVSKKLIIEELENQEAVVSS
ncbi:hypothetical protein HYU14_05700 [Candidatus Woesearchaeota archaeon]|nr:hypothetical protein [Candidatus Woesearchaeota archaeon]